MEMLTFLELFIKYATRFGVPQVHLRNFTVSRDSKVHLSCSNTAYKHFHLCDPAAYKYDGSSLYIFKNVLWKEKNTSE